MVEAAKLADPQIAKVAALKGNGVDGRFVGSFSTVWQTLCAPVIRDLIIQNVEEVIRLPRVANSGWVLKSGKKPWHA